ncbi:GyrI-like domain-containing protein [Frondihabitans cladoniiphilus]|uniref:GyrI-like domain-containing protein n=1 Tax=Frondihabitans cladoniiphilus TaxID=715785 RepID=UPI0031E7AACD
MSYTAEAADKLLTVRFVSKKGATMTNIRTTELHQAPADPELVVVPAAVFLSISGTGAPAAPVWHRKKLFASDIARELAKAGLAPEGTPAQHMYYWYADDAPETNIADFYSVNPLTDLGYRALAQIDPKTTLDDIAAARERAASASDEGDEIEIFTIPEQTVVQVMHTGPFSTELATLARMGAEADAHGVKRSGPHQEIHLDPFTITSAQDTLRTIIRDPVA